MRKIKIIFKIKKILDVLGKNQITIGNWNCKK